MSSIKLESNASGTGIFTIASPNSNTNRTLTLPNNTGTILTSATTTGFPAGSVIQVVSATYSTSTSITSTSYTDTGLSVTITPTSASSKILVLGFLSGRMYAGTNGDTKFYFSILRASTTVYEKMTDNLQAGTGAGGFAIWPLVDLMYLDSPSTTSSTTYKIQAKLDSSASSRTIQISALSSNSTITLMEVAA
jgi:hypothetical protein